ncbi:MAG: DUF3299 domain-containing protein [Leptospirales bacterium]|nr:DUF3299 domain-containing protein [Leptospirales bacterium]
MKYFRLTRSVILGAILLIGAVYLLQPRLPGKTNLPDFEPELVAQTDKAQVLDWKQLRELNVKTNVASPKLKAADGKTVRIAGFMVPLEDQADSVTEFLLVPYPQACIHVPAPPPNQIVHVKMAGGNKANMVWWEPIWAQGKLKIVRTPNMYTESSFQLSGIKTEPYQDDYDAPY